MIKGLQLAGRNPTSGGVIKALRGLKAYNGNGLLPQTINYSTIFGKGENPMCDWYVQARRNGFVPVSAQPLCGRPIPGTGIAPSSS